MVRKLDFGRSSDRCDDERRPHGLLGCETMSMADRTNRACLKQQEFESRAHAMEVYGEVAEVACEGPVTRAPKVGGNLTCGASGV